MKITTFKDMANESNFFDADSSAQRKYEMIRAHKVDGLKVTNAAERFGYSRPTFYTALNRFNKEGIEGLLDKPPGPRGPSKAKDEVVERIVVLRRENKSVYDIENDLKKENIDMSARNVERVLKKKGGFKKKRPQTMKINEYNNTIFQLRETNNVMQDTEESDTEKPIEEFKVEKGGLFFFIPLMLLFQFKDLMDDIGIVKTGISAIHFHLSLFFMNLFKIARISHLNDLSGEDRKLFAFISGTKDVLEQSGLHKFFDLFDRENVEKFMVLTGVKTMEIMQMPVKKSAENAVKIPVVNVDIHAAQRFTEKDIPGTQISGKNISAKATKIIGVQDQLRKTMLYMTTTFGKSKPCEVLVECLHKIKAMCGKYPLCVCFDLGFYNGKMFELLDKILSIKFITLVKRGTNVANILTEAPAALFEPIELKSVHRKYKKACAYDTRTNKITHYNGTLRLIIVKFKGKKKRVAFLTNDLISPVSEIIETYAKRWRIENWFKDAKDFFNLDDLPGFDDTKLDAYLTYKQLAANTFAVLRQELRMSYCPSTFYRKFICTNALVKITDTKICVEYDSFKGEEKFKKLFCNMNHRLEQLGIDPRVPWLQNRTIVFKFKDRM